MFLPFLDNLSVVCGKLFVEGMLEPYMRNKLKASQEKIGYSFVLEGLAYTMSSLPAGLVRIPL